MKKLAAIAGIAALSVSASVVPALASKPTDKGKPAPKTYPIKPCVPHKVAYIASGTLVSLTNFTQNPNGTYSGSLQITVKHANHHYKKAPQTTFTLTNARVKFGHGVDKTAPAAGSRVQVIGKITVLPHGCLAGTFTPTVTVRQVVIHAAAKH